jgi:hypothetical protein
MRLKESIKWGRPTIFRNTRNFNGVAEAQIESRKRKLRRYRLEVTSEVRH